MTQEQRERLEELASGRGMYAGRSVDRQLEEDGLIVRRARKDAILISAPTQKALALLRQKTEETTPEDPPPPAPLDEPLEGEAVDDRPFDHYPEDNAP